MIWTIFHGWISFLFGLATLAGYGLVKRLPVARAAFAYILPVAMLALIGGLCLLVYPDNVLREELLTYLPVVLLFYGLGLLWVMLRKEATETPALARAVIPAVVGGLVILGFVAVPVFASDAFRYRDAFTFTISSTTVKDGKLFVEGSIEIRKQGNYRFAAPRYCWAAFSDDVAAEPEVEQGQISWGASGVPQSTALGVFPLKIAWSKGVLSSAGALVDSYEDFISIEVHDPDQGEKVIYVMSAPMTAP